MQNHIDYTFDGERVSGVARKDHSRHYFSWPVMACIAALICAVCCTVLYQVHDRTRQLQQETESLRLTISAKEAELNALKQELQRVDSDGHVENVARQEHDFIRKGEIIFRFDDPSKLEGYTIEEYQFIMEEMRD